MGVPSPSPASLFDDEDEGVSSEGVSSSVATVALVVGEPCVAGVSSRPEPPVASGLESALGVAKGGRMGVGRLSGQGVSTAI